MENNSNGDQKMNEEIAVLVEELKAKVAEIKDLNLRTAKGLLSAVVIVVRFIESLSHSDRIFKTEKKSTALEVLNSLIDIPYLPEFLEHSIFSWLIDMTVETLNRTLGKLWIEKVNT